ncbi:ATP-grasp domain-containing protein [Candidatus Microgenomates bacterium]|nr:MAG: ATP-grasp domain-containing protein [Candidatus Microgenomates bacterium]
MKALIVGLVKNYHFKRVQEEAEKQGVEVDGCYCEELVINASSDNFEVSLRGKPLDYDLIYLWAFSKCRWEWITAVDYLSKTRGTKIINKKLIDPAYQYYLTSAIDYWKQNIESIPFPKSSVILSKKSVESVIGGYRFPVIIKPTEGRKGKNVFKCESAEEVKRAIDEMEGARAYVVREFIPNDGDIRVFTVGYRAIGAMKRTPKEGDFRSNISQGGSGVAYDLAQNPKVQEIAEKTARAMQTEIAGVDVIIHAETGEPYVLETNPGPQFEGLETYTDVNAAGEIVKYFKEVAEK